MLAKKASKSRPVNTSEGKNANLRDQKKATSSSTSAFARACRKCALRKTHFDEDEETNMGAGRDLPFN